MKRDIYMFLWIVQIIAVSIFIISLLLGGEFYLIGLSLMLGVFGVFYWFSPYMVKLEEVRFCSREIPWYKKLFFNKKKRANSRKERELRKDTRGDGEESREIYSD